MEPLAPAPDQASIPERLRLLGYNERFRDAFVEAAEPGLVPGRVARGDRGMYVILTDGGPVHAEVHRRFRRRGALEQNPAVGDWVTVRLSSQGDAVLERVLPRMSAFVRSDPGDATAAQVVAANIDVVLVMHALSLEPNLRRLERELVLAWESGADPVVVLSKADLFPDVEGALEAVRAVAVGVPVHVLSNLTGLGVPEIAAYASQGRTVALLGASGVGKSTLANLLAGEHLQATADVRPRDQKGRHTTVARELVPLPGGGVLIDTPGMRELQIWCDEEGLQKSFDDVEELGRLCRFTDCKHESEP
ncbi:MAG: ribosome small subunit-dependent GTPase A, partial [Thermoleophilia bacterium]|nr:ribosome small subunit-dependent GTPase A [Thermoleophilia bacterium]